MLDHMLLHSVQEISIHELKQNQDVILLDARELAEYEVSKIDEARWVGYDDFDFERISDISKDQEVIVYCSIGYRSEKIAERLKKEGFKNVKNLYGGIFSWVNNDKKVVDSLGQETNKVHAYNLIWGVWLDKGEKVY